ncbi:NAD(P)H-dependent oxidoreductase [Alysiella filiformis]|uniref:Modulator of drug activity B n=1 Tax=Alysiella filiformis DSM 16848 TaxID=1120981 RepID=A0A286ESF9_9NEIS|nr:NAD(P)H-dependent oxidoreductase [Alysiella filiformis]QMT32144.1 NAD(P)H-dependent oxidoreductase [Alysiella filiformis]UBQ56941.1 NAD(P)H-dependent oxidoreductase [Alysiella filiformis DSM 16848]SOD73846.1 modulator of drug activity B [Alysiella filiformis DSM 16848]
MQNILIINAHQPYDFSKGELTKSLIDIATKALQNKGLTVKHSKVTDYAVADELEKWQWADAVIFQFPSNWMMIPWLAKKYMDDVFTAGMGGILCNTDGRSSANPNINYGTGGLMKGKKYMLSATFNAPKNAFDNANEYLFAGKGLDDLFFPIHCNFRFFAMTPLPTFACYDVIKNPTIEQDLKDFESHINQYF